MGNMHRNKNTDNKNENNIIIYSFILMTIISQCVKDSMLLL